MTVIQQLTQHKSIRKYTDRAVEPHIMEQILQAVQCAPSWINGQQYSIISITDTALRQEITALAGNQPYIQEAPVFLVFCADFYRTKQACEMEDFTLEIDSPDFLTIAATDVGIALGTAVVAAESFGLGTVAIGGVRKSTAAIIERLQLPEGVLPISGLCIGYPAEEPLQKPRLPQQIIVHENTYKKASTESLEVYNTTMADYLKQRGTEGNWTKGVANFYKNGYPAYQGVEQAMKKQGFR